MPIAVLAIYTLWQRELIRFYRQPSRLMGALGTPLVFWLLIGSGFDASFKMSAYPNMNYMNYFYPGTILMILLFTSIFSTFSLIEDRKEGFLQSVLAAPVPRFSIILGKIFGGATLAFIQGFLFLLLAPVLGISLGINGWVESALMIYLNAFVLTTLGFAIAWKVSSVQGFHVIMNLFLMPLWFLSGALFPMEGAPSWIQWVMRINPLTYGLSSLRNALLSGEMLPNSNPSYLTSVWVMLGFAVAIFIIANLFIRQRKVEDIS